MAEKEKDQNIEEISEPKEEPIENAPEDEETIPLDPETGLDPEELKAELEDLKDLVQGEIDKMMDENPNAEWNDIVKAAAEEKKLRKAGLLGPKCECCGERQANEDGVYCDECLENMRHYPFEWYKWIIPVVTIVLVFLSFSFFAISFPVFKGTADAEQLVNKGKLMSALNAYDNINAEIKVTDDNYGSKYLERQVDLYYTIGVDSYEELTQFIDNHYSGTKIDKLKNRHVKEIKEEISAFSKIYDVYESCMQSASTYEKFSTEFDEGVKKIMLSNSPMAYYYKYLAAVVYGADANSQTENVKKIQELAPEMKTLYLPLFAEISLNEGKYDEVLSYTSQLSGVNSESIYVYLYKSVAYRMKGNLNMAIGECNKGVKFAKNDPMLNYQISIIDLLEGKTETAKNYAETAYNNASTVTTYLQASSMYALCAALTDDKETYNSICDELSESGFSLSPDVNKIIKGELTVEKVFTEGRGDFSWQ